MVDDEAPVAYSKRLVCAVVFAGAAALAFSALAIYYMSAMIASMAEARGNDRSDELVSLSCRSDGCARFEGLLRDTLNTSVDPCHDFKAYVTSRWLPSAAMEPDDHWRYAWNVKYAWMRNIADEIRRRYHATPLGRLIVSSFGACANRAQENVDETRRLFMQLLRDLGVPWPDTPPSDVDPFEAQLNLSVRWNIPLWFDVKMLPGKPVSGRKAIYVYPSAYANFWRGQYIAMSSGAAVRRYVDQYLAFFLDVDGTNQKTVSADHRRQCDRVFNFTKHVVFLLAEVSKHQRAAVFEFHTLAQAFGQKTERLVSLVNKYFRLNDSSFASLDKALVKAAGTMDVVRRITANADSSLVLSHLGWWTLQVYAPILDDQFFIQKYGSEENANLLRPLFCETQVESSFKLLLFANHIALNFPRRVRRSINELLTSVRDATVAEYAKSDLPVATKTRLMGKLKRLGTNLWPKAEYRSSKQLRRIYSFKYVSKKTMLDYWISERQGNAALIGSDAYFEDKRLPHCNAKDPFSYETILDTVTLSMIVVHEPFYYRDGDGAINYGGLGAGFAKTLLEGLERDQEFRDAAAGDASSGATQSNGSSPQDSVRNETSRSIALGGRAFLPAFRALMAARRNGTPLNAGQFSPAKVFFVNYCHSQTRLSAGFDCNSALRGAADFVTAFGCKQGSYMNPQY
ncbi:endothelin-converting enzyme 1-like [Dermacentor andersoni]|uniref:endothelin-converting enzyme 1-like n=1 Tax=Dermacentor andersoni TaxID=34620 RepID=UPI00215501C8|nr:endothelin-converting enzyme 1-like [Dermacentor andersoni]